MARDEVPNEAGDEEVTIEAGALGPVQRLTNETTLPEALPGDETKELAKRALASQSKPQSLVDALSPEQQAALAASLDEHGLATGDQMNGDEVVVKGTGRVVQEVLAEFWETHKATNADDDAPGEIFT